jgi:hypothetical protein
VKIRIKGSLYKLKLIEFIKAPLKDKKKLVSLIYNDKKESFIDYWFGYVEVRTQDIMVVDYDEKTKNPLYEASIIVGRHGTAQWFSHLDLDVIKQIIEKAKACTSKYFNLHIDFGGSMYQEYLFTKRQLKMLIPQLEDLVDKEWYKDDDCK